MLQGDLKKIFSHAERVIKKHTQAEVVKIKLDPPKKTHPMHVASRLGAISGWELLKTKKYLNG